ncbi:MAG: hypothetical protein AAB778_00800 [Patescibacteria group bacterium]
MGIKFIFGLTLLLLVIFILFGLLNFILEKDIFAFFIPPITYVLISTFSLHYLIWYFQITKPCSENLNYYLQIR